MDFSQIEIGKLFDDLLKSGCKIINYKTYELIYVDNIDVLTYGNKYTHINYVSRHKTPKHLIKITTESEVGLNDVTVTTDHICMIYNRDHFFDNTNAKNLKVGDYVSIYSEKDDKEYIGTISNIEDLGTTDEYVYDLEVEDNTHSFYANDILIHNSQFTNLQAITDDWIKRYNLPNRLVEWPEEWKLKLWNYFEEFVNTKITPFVRDLLHEWSHIDEEEAAPLRYGLEYIGDVGIYQHKKMYVCHHIIEEGAKIVDKTVYKGIELKKGNLDKSVKGILTPIYEKTLRTDYTQADFNNDINNAYDMFMKLGVEDIAFWKGYNTERESSGFLEMAKIKNAEGKTVGTTAISAACTYYNQLLQKLNIGDKYESIILGDKVRFVRVKSKTLPIKYIAFKNRWPVEFNSIMDVDYNEQFISTVKKPLEGYLLATKFNWSNPQIRIAESIDDL